MKVAYEVHEHLECEGLIGFRGLRIAQSRHVELYCRHDVAVGGHPGGSIGLVSVDVAVVPRPGIGVFRGMAGVVEPVGPIDYRAAVEQRVDGLGGFGGKMALGYGCRDVVALLAPCHCRKGCNHTNGGRRRPSDKIQFRDIHNTFDFSFSKINKNPPISENTIPFPPNHGTTLLQREPSLHLRVGPADFRPGLETIPALRASE